MSKKFLILVIAIALMVILPTSAYAQVIDDSLDPDGNGPKPSKYVIRNNMSIVVAGGRTLGYNMAADLLEHSLNDNPGNLSYSSTSVHSAAIKNSSEYRTIIAEIKGLLDQTSGSTFSYPRTTLDDPSTVMNSTTDLHLALNRVEYSVIATKINGIWEITTIFHDEYDFCHQSWRDYGGLTGAASTALNNYGAFAEDEGAIVSYHVYFSVTDTY